VFAAGVKRISAGVERSKFNKWRPFIKTSLIRDNVDPRFGKLIEIYRASIEPSEQKPPALLREMVGDTRYSFYVLEDLDDVIGFAIVFTPADREFWLLEYIAIEATRRDAGIGFELFMRVAKVMSTETSGAYGVMEVDQAVGDANVAAQARRRLGFYARCGCKMLQGLTYILPIVGDLPPPVMHILLWGAADSAVSKETLTRWLRIIYAEVYSQSRADIRIDQMTSELPEEVILLQIS
jgi:hypothetical protein